MSVLVYHHNLTQTCRLLQIPAPLGNSFINRNLRLCHAISGVKLKDSVIFALQSLTECTRRYKNWSTFYCQMQNICHYNAVWHLHFLRSLSFSFIQQPKSHIKPWIILTFHFHNSPLLLFFLSTGFKSQAGAWERKTVCWNLRIVFSTPLSKT